MLVTEITTTQRESILAESVEQQFVFAGQDLADIAEVDDWSDPVSADDVINWLDNV